MEPKTISIPGGEVRILPAEPFTDDRSDTYVLDVLGLTVLVRARSDVEVEGDDWADTETCVHIDDDGTADKAPGPVVVEVRNGGKVDYE